MKTLSYSFSFLTNSTYFSVPAFFRYAKNPALVKALLCPCSGSYWSTNKLHGKSLHRPQCSTSCSEAQAYSLHSPQNGFPLWVPHPEQCGILSLRKYEQDPQYAPQGARSSLPNLYFSRKGPYSLLSFYGFWKYLRLHSRWSIITNMRFSDSNQFFQSDFFHSRQIWQFTNIL